MAFHRWQIGLHIQQDTIRIVAVMLRRGGWQLCHWWQIPRVSNGLYQPAHMLTQALADWRHQLPARHDVRMAYCASRTVQRHISCPRALCEADRARYIASATAQQLQMAEQDLCWDYQACCQQSDPLLREAQSNQYEATDSNQLTITAAHQQDINALRECARALKLQLSAITPDASALTGFFPWLPVRIRLICFTAGQHWLWASRQHWGTLSNREAELPASSLQAAPLQTSLLSALPLHTLCQRLGLNNSQIAHCGEPPDELLPCRLADRHEQIMIFDPWQMLSYSSLQPPAAAAHFAVALGLAIGKYPQ